MAEYKLTVWIDPGSLDTDETEQEMNAAFMECVRAAMNYPWSKNPKFFSFLAWDSMGDHRVIDWECERISEKTGVSNG